MTLDQKALQRLRFPARVVRKECRHLATPDQRLFGSAQDEIEQRGGLDGKRKPDFRIGFP